MHYLIVSAFIGLDLLTGVVNAFKQKAFTSSIMREGLFHKVGSLFCICFASLVDWGQNYLDLGVNIPIAISVCTYISLMECGSIMENVCSINPEIAPEKLKQYFSKLRGN